MYQLKMYFLFGLQIQVICKSEVDEAQGNLFKKKKKTSLERNIIFLKLNDFFNRILTPDQFWRRGDAPHLS